MCNKISYHKDTQYNLDKRFTRNDDQTVACQKKKKSNYVFLWEAAIAIFRCQNKPCLPQKFGRSALRPLAGS